jgi:pimeloyl-ACP methyl ester carboxylesterase
MQTEAFSEADIREALGLYQWDSRCACTDTGWDEFETACDVAKGKPWYDNDVHPYNRGDRELRQWALIHNYDPVTVLRQVHCPVLSIFGDADPLVPAQTSANIWKSALREAGNEDVTIKMFPDADHGISEIRTGMQPADYFILQRDWLLKHLGVRAGSRAGGS